MCGFFKIKKKNEKYYGGCYVKKQQRKDSFLNDNSAIYNKKILIHKI